jgi:hypothetical protein
MADPTTVSELVLRWQELRDEGRAVSAEELCAGRPELLGELRRQIEALGSMERFLGASGMTPESAARAEAPTVRLGEAVAAAGGAPLVRLGPGGRSAAPGPVPATPVRGEGMMGRRPGSRGTRYGGSWVGAAWASCTGPGR